MSEESLSSESSELESVDSAQDAAPVANSSEQQALQDLVEEFELKVNGKTVKEQVNLKDKARIQKALQMEKAAQEAFQSKAQLERKIADAEASVEQFFKVLQSDPSKILKNSQLGLSRDQLRAFAEDILNEELERSAKSPEQIALEEARAELQRLQHEKQMAETAKQQAEFERLQNEAAVQIEKEIIEAIDVGELPKSNYITKKMADLAYIAFTNGIDIDMKDLIPLVKKQYLEDIRDMLGKLPDEIVEELISRDRVKKIRNSYLSSLKKQNVQQVKVSDSGSKSEGKASPQKLTFKQMFPDF